MDSGNTDQMTAVSKAMVHFTHTGASSLFSFPLWTRSRWCLVFNPIDHGLSSLFARRARRLSDMLGATAQAAGLCEAESSDG